jgi:hypothetical protein
MGMVRKLGIRMISLGISFVSVNKKVKAKTSLAGIEAQGVVIRMDASARWGNTRGCIAHEFRFDHLQTVLVCTSIKAIEYSTLTNLGT